MPKKSTTKTEKLLKAIKKSGGMTRKEIVQFLVGKRNYNDDPSRFSGYWNAQLYGTSKREGILRKFCYETYEGDKTVWVVDAPIKPPFYEKKDSSYASPGNAW